MARANSAEDEGIVWDTPGDEGIVWDAPRKKPKGPSLTAAQRFLRGLRDPIDGGAQLLESVVPQGVKDGVNSFNNYLADKTGLVGRVGPGGVAGDVARAEQEYSGPEGMDWARIAGNVFNPVNLVPALRGATTIPRMAAQGAVAGALGPSAAEGEDFWGDKGMQAGVGAAGGAAIGGLFRGASRVMSPNASRVNNPHGRDIAMLRREGVQPTVGQTLGGNWSRTEQKLTSLPFVGDGIAGARARALDQFDIASINRATRNIGVNIDEPGQAGVRRARQAVTHAYDDAGNQMGAFRLDRRAIQELRNVRNMAQRLTPDNARAFDDAWTDMASQMGPRGQMLPDNFKRVDSELGRLGAEFSGSSSAHEKQLGRALREAQRVLRDSGHRQNPNAAAAYRRADRAHSNLVRVEGASNKAGLTERWTPGQLLGSIKQQDKSARKGVNARGEALMQDLGNAGQRVLGNTVPDSGTAGRAALIAGGGLAGGTGLGLIEPTTAIVSAVGMGLGRLAYTPAGQRLLNVMVSSRPNSPAYHAAAAQLRRLAQHGAPAGGVTANNFFDEE